MSGRCELQPWPAYPGVGFGIATSLVPHLVRFGRGWTLAKWLAESRCQCRPNGSPYSDDCDGHLWLDNGGACRG